MVLGHLLGVLEECVIVAAGISNKSIFATPFGRKVAAYNNKLYWANNQFSDCMATLFAYNTWKKQCSGDQVQQSILLLSRPKTCFKMWFIVSQKAIKGQFSCTSYAWSFDDFATLA